MTSPIVTVAHSPSFQCGVVTLCPADVELLAVIFTTATAHAENARVAIDDGGVKVAVGGHGWTPAIGSIR